MCLVCLFVYLFVYVSCRHHKASRSKCYFGTNSSSEFGLFEQCHYLHTYVCTTLKIFTHLPHPLYICTHLPHPLYTCTHHTLCTPVHTTTSVHLYTPHPLYTCTHHTLCTPVHITPSVHLYTLTTPSVHLYMNA